MKIRQGIHSHHIMLCMY